jgi:hypothetical protein
MVDDHGVIVLVMKKNLILDLYKIVSIIIIIGATSLFFPTHQHGYEKEN